MNLRFSKQFNKQLGKLTLQQQDKFWHRIELWQEDPNHPLLRSHKLAGKLANYHSINITGDIRALYEIVDDEIYLNAMIGTHS